MYLFYRDGYMKEMPEVSKIDPFEKLRKKIRIPEVKKPAGGVRSSGNLSSLDTESASLARSKKQR